MCPAGSPAPLLLLNHALADHLIDGRLDEDRGNRLAVPIPVSVIWNERLVDGEIPSQFLERFEQFLLLTIFFEDLKIDLHILDRSKR